MEPVADDRDGFVRVLVGQFADFLHRLGVTLALDLRDIDHRGRTVGDSDGLVTADDRYVWAARRCDAAADAGNTHAASSSHCLRRGRGDGAWGDLHGLD